VIILNRQPGGDKLNVTKEIYFPFSCISFCFHNSLRIVPCKFRIDIAVYLQKRKIFPFLKIFTFDRKQLKDANEQRRPDPLSGDKPLPERFQICYPRQDDTGL